MSCFKGEIVRYIPSKESQAFGKWITNAIEEEFAEVSKNRKDSVYYRKVIWRKRKLLHT